MKTRRATSKVKILAGFFLLSASRIFGGVETTGYGPASFSCGQASILFRDVWAVQNNPGALGYLRQSAAAASFERRYGTFSMLSFSAAYKNEKYGNFGLGASRFGPDFYSQSRLGISWGKTFGIASLGLQFQGFQVSAENLASRQYLLFHFGGMAKLGEKLSFAGTISNLSQTKASDYTGIRLPTIIKAGLLFQPNESLLVMAEIQKDLDEKAGVAGGIEYRANKMLVFRTGFNSSNQTASLGFGLSWREFLLDFGSSWHAELGMSHCLGLQYQFGKKSSEKESGKK